MFDAKCSKLYDSLAEIEQQLTLVTNNLELHKR